MFIITTNKLFFQTAGMPEFSNPASLELLSVVGYLNYLQEECAAFVEILMLDCPVWNPVGIKLLALLKKQVNDVINGERSPVIRKVLYQHILNGSFPSDFHTNSHGNVRNDRRDSADDQDDEDELNEANSDLDKIKHFGRKCSNFCCTGAFIVEVMLSVIINADIQDLIFPEDLPKKLYKKQKAIRRFLNFDVTSLLVH